MSAGAIIHGRFVKLEISNVASLRACLLSDIRKILRYISGNKV
jgi:hypothetical protein